MEKHSDKSQYSILYRILENLDAYIYVSDPDTNEILYINSKMNVLFSGGIKVGDICWKVFQKDFPGPCPFCPNAQLKREPGSQHVWEEHNTVTDKYFKNTDTLIEWENGKLVHLQHSVDITDSKHAEIKLKAAVEEAERANSAKSHFLSRMSHEIRTPMNAIIGMTNIARSLNDIERIKQCLGKIDGSSRHLLGIINDILDMSKIEADKLEIYNEDFNLEKLLMDICNIIMVRMEEKKQNLNVHIAKGVSVWHCGDSLRLSQVITNLLSNAVKFSPEYSEIKLAVERVSIKDGYNRLKFSVKDSGIGMSAETVAKLFTPFEQADGGIARKFGGTGLGLTISKQIVNLMGGDIHVESEEGKGSTFYFTVNLKQASPAVASLPERRLTKEALKVLVVDDSPEILEFFTVLFDESNINVITAASGEEGVRIAEKENTKGEPFNIIFMDWRLPGMNGVDAAKAIKEKYARDCVVIIISMSDWSQIEPQATGAGVAKYLPKPLFPSSVVDTINEVLGIAEPRARVTVHNELPDLSGRKILLAEDIEINVEILCALLEPSHVEVVHAENGAAALEAFTNDQSFDLIFMDVHMPLMDGYEATRKIRALPLPKAKTIPIVAMTANVFKEDVMRCLENGMNDHIAKPIDEKTLIQKINKYFTATAGNDKAQADAAVKTEETMNAETFMPYININEGLERLRGNKKLYSRLIKTFEQNTDCAAVRAALDAGDLIAAQNKAHALKGVAANLSINGVFAAAKDLDALLKDGASTADLFAALEKTEESMKKTLELLPDLARFLEA